MTHIQRPDVNRTATSCGATLGLDDSCATIGDAIERPLSGAMLDATGRPARCPDCWAILYGRPEYAEAVREGRVPEQEWT